MNLQKRKILRIPKILKAAEGEECTVNSPACNYDKETTVFAHFNESYAGKGGSQKADDCAGVFACSDCHDLLDGRSVMKSPSSAGLWDLRDKEWYWRRAYYRTIRRLIELGVLK